MKKIGFILPCLCLALVPFTAKADPMLTNNPGNPHIGPYSMTLNPGGPLSLFCLDDLFHIDDNESWFVQVVQGNQLTTNALTMGSATLFEDEAFILSQLSVSNDTDVQEALWHIFDTSESPITAGAQNLLNELAGSMGTAFLTSGGYDNYVYYIYDPNGGPVTNQDCPATGAACFPPQNFIDPTPRSTPPTPEPSSLMLLGSGLIGLAAFARRKIRM